MNELFKLFPDGSKIRPENPSEKAEIALYNMAKMFQTDNDSHFPSGSDRISAQCTLERYLKKREIQNPWHREFVSICENASAYLEKEGTVVKTKKKIFEVLIEFLRDGQVDPEFEGFFLEFFGAVATVLQQKRQQITTS